jgi:radical SAM superfamily enzyme YgiQ (UPF0313 family)
MRIALVKPNIGRQDHSLYVDEARMEPLQLGVLAGLTPPDVECLLFDDRMEPVGYDEPVDLAAVTVEIYTARRAYEIAAEYRARGVPVIMGGFHPTLVPQECLEHADAICIGDAETLWGQVVEDARRGRLRRVYRAAPGAAQPGGIRPRRELFRGKGYLPITLVQFSRGCPYRCDFCAISAYFEHRHHVRPIPEVLAEIEAQERRFVFFVDDNLLADHAAAKRLLRALVPLKIRWVSQGSIDMTRDPELMDLLEQSGCFGNVIGFESLDPRNLRSMRKAPNLVGRRAWDDYQAACEILRAHHLQTWAAFTLGHDHDTAESIRATHRFALANRFCFAAYNILMPYPATPLHERLEREGRLLYEGRWWLHPEYRFNHAAFVPAHMSPDELTEAVWRCRHDWNRPGSVFWRFWDFKTHLSSPARAALYLAYNPLYAKETFKKQGLLFGLSRQSVDPRRPGPLAQAALGAASAAGAGSARES